MIPPDPGASDQPPTPPPATDTDPSLDDDARASATEPGAPAPARPGASTFTIEGRSAPALFVVGWLATLVGLVAIFVSVLAGASTARAVVLILGLVLLSVGLIAAGGSQAIERRVRGTRAYMGPSPFLVFAASIPLTILGGAVIGLALSVVGISVSSPVAAVAAVSIQALIYVGLIRLLVVDAGALRWAEMGVRRLDRRALGELVTGAIWTGPVILVTLVVAAVLSQLIPVTPASPLPPTGTVSGLLLNLIAGAIIAPIGEELFFRAFAATAWARDIGERRTVVRVALFFAVAHVLTIAGSDAQQAISLAIVAFVGRIPVAVALTWLFLQRRSIWVSIGLHATFNGVLLVISEIARGGVAPG